VGGGDVRLDAEARKRSGDGGDGAFVGRGMFSG
jgi:hypothetical protein